MMHPGQGCNLKESGTRVDVTLQTEKRAETRELGNAMDAQVSSTNQQEEAI